MFNPLHSILSFSFLRFPIIWHFLHATGFKISIWYVFIHFGRLRTIRYSNVHRTFELRSCPHGFESLSVFVWNQKDTQMDVFLSCGRCTLRTLSSQTDLSQWGVEPTPFPPWKFAVFPNCFLQIVYHFSCPLSILPHKFFHAVSLFTHSVSASAWGCPASSALLAGRR